MDIAAHALWTAAAAITANRAAGLNVAVAWTAWWGVFPDVAAFGPTVAYGVWLKATGGLAAYGGHVPHIHFGFPVYPAVHSLVVFLGVFGVVCLLARRIVPELLGWMLHILIDIPTHSFSYYATRFLWPLSGLRVDGVAWWTPWFWISTYAAIAVVYFFLWRAGWLAIGRAEKKTGRWSSAR